MGDQTPDPPEIEAEAPAETGPCGAGPDQEFVRDVHRKELDYVRHRREAAGSGQGEVDPSAAPSTRNSLVGLAFSGGGIRSATFNLGILQALHRWGLFKHVDLLSTVSGGGFIGSSLTSQMSQGQDFPFTGESPAVVHLRNNSNYLAPRGVFDYLRMFAVLIRGIILNFLVLVPFLLIPCLIAAVVYGPQLLSRLEYDETTELSHRYLEAAAVSDGVTIEGGRPIQRLVTLLRKRGFVRLGVAQKEREISDALQKQDSSYREVTEPLITGMGSKTVPHTFLGGVTLRDVARRLMDAHLFEDHNAIEEIQAVELFLRSEGIDDSSPSSLMAGLTRHLADPPEVQPFMVFVSTQTLAAVLRDRKILKPGCSVAMPRVAGGDGEPEASPAYLESCEFALLPDGTRYSLTQMLQAFYEEKLFDRRWLEQDRAAAHDETVRYRWPNDSPGNREVEATAWILWRRLSADWDQQRGLELSVPQLFATLEGLGGQSDPGNPLAKTGSGPEPLVAELKDPGKLLKALRASGVVGDVKGDCDDPSPPAGRPSAEARSSPAARSSPFAKKSSAGRSSPLARQSPPAKRSPLAKTSSPLAEPKAPPAEPKAPPAGTKSPFAKSRSPFAKTASTGGSAATVNPFAARQQGPSCSLSELHCCSFDRVRGPLKLPGILYKQELYNKKWFEENRELWDDSFGKVRRPAEPKYGSESSAREREIEAAGRTLDLKLSQTVGDVLEHVDGLRKGKGFILPSVGRHEVLDALQKAKLVGVCSLQRADRCHFTTSSAHDAIPQLFYERRFYERSWFEGHSKGKIAYLSGPAAAVDELRKPCKTVKSLFDRLKSQPELVGEVSRKKLFGHLRDKRLITDLKTKRGTKKCRFGDMASCAFESDRPEGALWELYFQGWLKTEKLESASALGASEFNRWYEKQRARISGLWSRVVRPSSDEIFWSPHVLRMPLTGRVAILGLGWVLVFPLLVLVWKSYDGGRLRKRDLIERSLSIFMVAIAAVAFFELQPYLIYHWHYLDVGASWSLVVGAVSLISTLAAGPALSFFKKFGRKIVILLVSLLGFLLPFMIYLFVMDRLIYADWPTRSGYTLDMEWVFLYFILAALTFHLFLLAMDPNSTSIHNFYRDRLSDAYLVGLRRKDPLIPEENLKLSRLCPNPGSAVPYHLINVALNLQGSANSSLRDRRSEFFLFSKHYVGGRYTGYCETEDMQRAVPELGVGTAMAVSGAAAAPNMGAFTVGPLVVLLSLLNIRLGYWIPNPQTVRKWLEERGRWKATLRRLPEKLVGRYRLRPGPYLFLKELSSRMDEKGRFVNVSDGGHLENTATFELLRRRCKFIIAADAEADEKMSFAGLATLIRLARIDLNVEIKIDVRPLRLKDGRSSRHVTVGCITYPPCPETESDEETGYLIYLKASVTGDEDEIVSEYRRRHPAFPHESTADQFFDETQFEAYRDLGFHVGESLFEGHEGHGCEDGAVLAWLEAAADRKPSERDTGPLQPTEVPIDANDAAGTGHAHGAVDSSGAGGAGGGVGP